MPEKVTFDEVWEAAESAMDSMQKPSEAAAYRSAVAAQSGERHPYKPGEVLAMIRGWLANQPDKPRFTLTRAQLLSLVEGETA